MCSYLRPTVRFRFILCLKIPTCFLLLSVARNHVTDPVRQNQLSSVTILVRPDGVVMTPDSTDHVNWSVPLNIFWELRFWSSFHCHEWNVSGPMLSYIAVSTEIKLNFLSDRRNLVLVNKHQTAMIAETVLLVPTVINTEFFLRSSPSGVWK